LAKVKLDAPSTATKICQATFFRHVPPGKYSRPLRA
jgi:hypothetical protein